MSEAGKPEVKALLDLARAEGLLQFHFSLPRPDGPLVVAGTFGPQMEPSAGFPLDEELGWDTELDRGEPEEAP